MLQTHLFPLRNSSKKWNQFIFLFRLDLVKKFKLTTLFYNFESQLLTFTSSGGGQSLFWMTKASGALLLVTSTILFIVFTVWILFTPFLEHDVEIVKDWFPKREYIFIPVGIFVLWSSILIFSTGYVLTIDDKQPDSQSRLRSRSSSL